MNKLYLIIVLLGLCVTAEAQYVPRAGANLGNVTATTVTTTGIISSPGVILRTDTNIGFPSLGFLGVTTDGLFLFRDAAGTSVGRLMLGGATSSFPGIARNGANVEIKDASGGTAGGLIVNGGTAIKLTKSATATLDFTSTAAQTSAELTITLTGAADGDDIIISPPNGSNNANTCFTARVSSANTVSVKFNNFSSGAVDPASGTFRVSLVQF